MKLFQNFSLEKLKSVFPSIAPRKLISIHIGKNSVKAITVKRTGKKVSIVSSAEVETEPDVVYDINKTGRALSTVLNELGSIARQGIIVTERVKFLASELPVPPGTKLSEDKLSAAVAWEMEPYLDFPARDGIFDYRLVKNKTILGSTPVLISAMTKDEFNGMSEILKDFRISLCRAYSPESALAFSSWIKDKDEDKIAVNCRQDVLTGIYMKALADPFLIQSFPVEPGILVEDQIKTMVLEINASAGDIKKIVIAGDAASEELAERIKTKVDADVRIWRPEKDLEEYGVTVETADLHPGYAEVIGASLQELGFSGKPVGVTGIVPLIKQAREHAYLAPAAGLAVIIVCFLGHYGIVKHRIGYYTTEISSLEKKKKALTMLQEERASLQSRQSSASKKKRYLEDLLPARQKNLLLLLTQLPEVIPNDMVMKNLTQKEAAAFSIAGFALRTGSIGVFAGKLSKLDGCREVKIKSITKQDPGEEKVSFPYEFCMEVVLKK